MPQQRVAVAMSGGVDSAVAAAILKRQGYQVIGVTMLLDPEQGEKTAEMAKKTAESLAVPHQVFDFRRLFKKRVIAPFCDEYRRGRTPNPCIACNRYIKFGALLDKAKGLGADFLASGHYARVEPAPEGYLLLRGIDRAKDQSYFLYSLEQGQLKYLLLPIGSLYKSQVRRIARELDLSDSARGESQDICFAGGGDHHFFISQRIPSPPGDIVDSNGRVLGRHRGLSHYTVGQRQGLGLASNRRLYVIRLDARNNRLVVGSREQLLSRHLLASHLQWVSGRAPPDTAGITAKARYRSPDVGVRLRLNNGNAEVEFVQPQPAITPGQSIVFYKGKVVLGGGVIQESGLI